MSSYRFVVFHNLYKVSFLLLSYWNSVISNRYNLLLIRWRHWKWPTRPKNSRHYNDVIMGTMASQITSLTIFYSTVYSDADQRRHQSPASLAFVRGIHRWIPAQMASNTENVSIWWHHHGDTSSVKYMSIQPKCIWFNSLGPKINDTSIRPVQFFVGTDLNIT